MVLIEIKLVKPYGLFLSTEKYQHAKINNV